MISTLAGLGGFGFGRMQIDFTMHVVRAPPNAPMRTIVGFPSNSEYYSPDCNAVGTQMPVPADGAIESSSNLSCDNNGNDCHLLVWQGNRLYEAYRANATGTSGLQSQCMVTWKLDQVYPASGRGEHCTSTDAAGFPEAPLLFNADVVQAWSRKHDRPILLGEFGAYDRAPMDSRVRWTDAVARAAEERGFAFAYWQFSSDFLLWDFSREAWVEPILRAVLPDTKALPPAIR